MRWSVGRPRANKTNCCQKEGQLNQHRSWVGLRGAECGGSRIKEEQKTSDDCKVGQGKTRALISRPGWRPAKAAWPHKHKGAGVQWALRPVGRHSKRSDKREQGLHPHGCRHAHASIAEPRGRPETVRRRLRWIDKAVGWCSRFVDWRGCKQPQAQVLKTGAGR